MPALNSTVRGLSVEPVWTSRFTISLEKSVLPFAPPCVGDLHDAALDRRGVVVARHIVAADHVEDDVGAAAAGRLLGERRRNPPVL